METLNCMKCKYRHEDNGNCTAVGGFCTAVQAAYCPLLREYLDTGLEPEAVETVKLALAAKHLVDLETLYYLNGKYIIEVDVVGYKVDETGAWLFIGETYNPETNRAYHCDLETERIGKTVFFAREEAEKALQEMEGKG